jgi:mono/diheme cytochrome c family protein
MTRAGSPLRVGIAATAAWLAVCAIFVGCADTTDPIANGRRVYAANCLACHHTDPTLEGVMGPPIAGSSRELIELRVLRGEYPPGYTPQRDTQLMVPLPYLKDDIEVLAAYLASVEPR